MKKNSFFNIHDLFYLVCICICFNSCGLQKSDDPTEEPTETPSSDTVDISTEVTPPSDPVDISTEVTPPSDPVEHFYRSYSSCGDTSRA